MIEIFISKACILLAEFPTRRAAIKLLFQMLKLNFSPEWNFDGPLSDWPLTLLLTFVAP